MNPKVLFICAIAGLLLGLSRQSVAQQPAITIGIVATFDYPGSGNSTTATGINDLGDVTGYFEDTASAIRGFIRYADGTFSAPIVEPNDVGNITVAKDIDNTGRICGYYFGSEISDPYRGFFLSGTTFTEYGLSPNDTYVNGLNDRGDFCGSFRKFSDFSGFVVRADGYGASWGIGNGVTEANAINVHDGIVGNYTDDIDSTVHGYLRDTDVPFGNFRLPIDYPGASQTFLLGLNDGGRIIVGKYVDSVGATHGLILRRPNTFSSFDYPGATETSLNGINNLKLISGYYAEASGVRHGFIARVGSR